MIDLYHTPTRLHENTPARLLFTLTMTNIIYDCGLQEDAIQMLSFLCVILADTKCILDEYNIVLKMKHVQIHY